MRFGKDGDQSAVDAPCITFNQFAASNSALLRQAQSC